MSWIKFSKVVAVRYGKESAWYYALSQDNIKGITINPDNEIVFDLGDDTLYSTGAYYSQNQALMIMNDVLNKWGKNIEIPSPKDVAKYLEGINDAENKECDGKQS